MSGTERELQRRNREKERMEESNYEIPYLKDSYFDCAIENEDIVCEIAEIIIKKKLTYKEANRVLYHTDKVLYERIINSSL